MSCPHKEHAYLTSHKVFPMVIMPTPEQLATLQPLEEWVYATCPGDGTCEKEEGKRSLR